MSVSQTLTPPGATRGADALDVSALWSPSFPSSELVSAAAGLLTPLPGWDGSEGARARIVIGPGMVAVSEVNAARAERAHERRAEARRKDADIAATDLLLPSRITEAEGALDAVYALADAGAVEWRHVDDADAWLTHLERRVARLEEPEGPVRARITAWSAKSRARMVRTLLGLDYAPMYAAGGVPAMLTLTYPGDWEAVAPSAKVCKGHLDELKRRYKRVWGADLVGLWKREFQERGAPHYHIMMVPPTGEVNGETFRGWVSRVWAAIVGSASCGSCSGPGSCCERARHWAAGTGLDYREGVRYHDPKRLAVYFSKHGSFSAKDYQNHAPEAWIESGSVGRFWGYWGLEVGTATVEVTQREALAAARTMRRWQDANGYRVQREVWRTNTRTGVMRKRRSGSWSGARMRGRLGFVAVNNGPAFVSQLVRYLDQVRETE